MSIPAECTIGYHKRNHCYTTWLLEAVVEQRMLGYGYDVDNMIHMFTLWQRLLDEFLSVLLFITELSVCHWVLWDTVVWGVYVLSRAGQGREWLLFRLVKKKGGSPSPPSPPASLLLLDPPLFFALCVLLLTPGQAFFSVTLYPSQTDRPYSSSAPTINLCIRAFVSSERACIARLQIVCK